ncbi:hypothetical protein [uncultured Tateyamaria sp.]|uniref:hypothetical protein n=1 Tax=uncultured Tateyamaria sp. TaxID=455651 RepID=UPI002638C2D5|nr:hypothetical protein [uncultured Tateyamaria sp.]
MNENKKPTEDVAFETVRKIRRANHENEKIKLWKQLTKELDIDAALAAKFTVSGDEETNVQLREWSLLRDACSTMVDLFPRGSDAWKVLVKLYISLFERTAEDFGESGFLDPMPSGKRGQRPPSVRVVSSKSEILELIGFLQGRYSISFNSAVDMLSEHGLAVSPKTAEGYIAQLSRLGGFGGTKDAALKLGEQARLVAVDSGATELSPFALKQIQKFEALLKDRDQLAHLAQQAQMRSKTNR